MDSKYNSPLRSLEKVDSIILPHLVDVPTAISKRVLLIPLDVLQ